MINLVTRWANIVLMFSLILAVAAPGAFADATKPVAVFNLEVNGPQEMAYLSKGLADMLNTRLLSAKTVKTIDRSKLNKAGIPTEETAFSLAGDLGAGIFILGSFTDLGDGDKSLDIQIIDTDNNSLINALGIQGSSTAAMIDDAARKIISSITSSASSPTQISTDMAVQPPVDSPAAESPLTYARERRAFKLTAKTITYEDSDYSTQNLMGGQITDALNKKERTALAREYFDKLLIGSTWEYDGEFITFMPGIPVEGIPKSGIAGECKLEDGSDLGLGLPINLSENNFSMTGSTNIEIRGSINNDWTLEITATSGKMAFSETSSVIVSVTTKAKIVTEKQ